MYRSQILMAFLWLTFSASARPDFAPPSTLAFVEQGAGYQTLTGDVNFLPDGVALPHTRITFAGALPTVHIEPGAPLPGTYNYYGADAWRESLPTYAALHYRALYPGIDLTYESDTAGLKSTFTLVPGADFAQIRWTYSRLADLTLIDGDLHVTLTSGATLIERAPVAWQVIDGVRVPVAVRYHLDADQHISFAVGAYDPALPLILDPVLEYATFIGGTGDESAHGVVLDDAGFAYVVGTTLSSDFPLTFGSYTWINNVEQVTVVKFDLNASGAASRVWSTVLSGGRSDDVALDANGHIYITGFPPLNMPTFPTTASAYSTTCTFNDLFLTRLDNDGQMVYSTCLGGSGLDRSGGVGVDAAGRAYLAGTTTSTDFPTTASAYTEDETGSFVSVLDTNQSGAASLVYSSYFGNFSAVNDVAADDAGNLFLTGTLDQTGYLPVTANAFQPTLKRYGASAGQDAFVARFDTTQSGTASLVYASFYGGSVIPSGFGVGVEQGHKIATDGLGGAYIVGSTSSADLPVNNGYDLTYNGTLDVFLARFDTTQSGAASLPYATYLGGSFDDEPAGLAVTPLGTAYLFGTASTQWPLRDALPGMPVGANGFEFLTKVDTQAVGADSLVFSSLILPNMTPNDLAINSVGDVVVVGSVSNSVQSLPLTTSYQPTNAGGRDLVLLDYRFTAEINVVKTADLTPAIAGSPVTITTTITNAGPDPAARISTIEELPAGVDFVAAPGCNYDAPHRLVHCSRPTIPVGGSVTLTTTIMPQTIATYTLPTTVFAFENDTDLANNTAELALDVVAFTDLVPALLSPFAWHPVPGADDYELALGRSDPPAQVITVAATSYTPTGALLYDTYFWRVRARKAGDYTQWSATQTFSITAPADAVPNLHLEPLGSVTLNWQPLTWAVGYHVQVSRTPDFALIAYQAAALPAGVTTTTFPVDESYGTFYWRVRGQINATQWGNWSVPQTFTVAAP